jgi:hypothetical protein
MTIARTRIFQALALFLAASGALSAQAKKYAPTPGAPTATVRIEVETSGVSSSGRNYFTVAAFAPERCRERNRKQAGFAQLEMRDRSENATAALAIEAGKPIVLSFLYVGSIDVGFAKATQWVCNVDGAATFAAGDQVVARFHVDAKANRCEVDFASGAASSPEATSSFAMYPMLCWPEDGDRQHPSGEGYSSVTTIKPFKP